MEKSVALGGYTPTNLHYVRNHGPTPRLDWGGHRVTVEGLVDRPTTFTMDQLISLPSVTIPVTLVKPKTPPPLLAFHHHTHPQPRPHLLRA